MPERTEPVPSQPTSATTVDALDTDGSDPATPEPTPAGGGNGHATTERLRKGRTLAERRAERRRALLDAALDRFAEKGYPATTIEEICRAASVSTRNFYEEFDNREALLLELYGELLHRMVTAVNEGADGLPATDDQFRAMALSTRARIGAFVRVCTDDPRIARVALIETVGVSPAVEARRRAAHRMFAAYIASQAREFAAAGSLPEDDYELISIGMVGAINEVLIDWVLREDPTPVDRVIDRLHRMFIGFTALAGPPLE